MRPPSVYAACTARDPCDLLRLLHGPHRVACRLLMILLSQQGCSASQVAGLLGYDPSTVRRWIHRYHQHGTTGLADRPRSGRPRLDSPHLTRQILRLLRQPKAWTISRLHQRLGRRPTISLRTLHRRVREVAAWRRPRLVAKGDPTATRSLPNCTSSCAPCPMARWCWPRMKPTSTCCPGSARPGSREARGSGSLLLGGTDAAPSSAPSTRPAASGSTRSDARPSAPASAASARSCWPPTRPRQWWRSCATTSSSTAPRSCSGG
jgi:transposase